MGQEEEKKQKDASASLAASSPGYQPLSSLTELFDKSLKIFKHIIGRYIALYLLATAAYIALAFFAVLGFVFASQYESWLIFVGLAVFGLVLLAAVFAFAFVVQAATYLLVRDAEKDLGILELLKKAKSKVFDFLSVILLSAFSIMLWSFLFIVPGVIAALRYSLAPWVYFYEGLKGTAALKRSNDLVKGYTAAVFARFGLLYLLFFLVVFIPLAVLDLVEAPRYMVLAWNVISQALAIASGPFFLVFSCFVYWDLVKIKGPAQKDYKANPLALIAVLVVLFAIISFFTLLTFFVLSELIKAGG